MAKKAKREPRLDDECPEEVNLEPIREACTAYGIDPEYLMGRFYDELTGEVMLVTHGGKKVSWRAGMTVAKLSAIEVTGVNPEWARRKVITGPGK